MAVFAYMVAFGKIPGAAFFPVFKGFTLEKERAALFFPAHRGFYGDYQDFI
ncbi:hypothetical protein [Bacillus salacetis]|uniref:hypothetical protein n=1 Tax=Bacillus salacetis TaxID=2315464 RepID=UPI001443E935|nr:hypothetical protein [Bacillus salacetis]